MDKEVFEHFLETRYNPSLNWYQERAFRNQQTFKTIQWSLIIVSMITSILVGIEQFFDGVPIKVATLVASVVVSGLATASKTFNYQEKSVFYRKVVLELENEFDQYNSGSNSYETVEDKERHFMEQVRVILYEGSSSLGNMTLSSYSKKQRKEAPSQLITGS